MEGIWGLKGGGFFIFFALIGCGRGRSPSNQFQSQNAATVFISVSPTSATIPLGASQQFTAAVTGTTNPAVTWSVNQVAGGSSQTGQISSTGLYTAPATVPNPATVTVTATAQAAPGKSA